jgi:hypothetical protein
MQRDRGTITASQNATCPAVGLLLQTSRRFPKEAVRQRRQGKNLPRTSIGWREVTELGKAITPVDTDLSLGEVLLKRELREQSFGAVERKTGMSYRALRGIVQRARVEVK